MGMQNLNFPRKPGKSGLGSRVTGRGKGERGSESRASSSLEVRDTVALEPRLLRQMRKGRQCWGEGLAGCPGRSRGRHLRSWRMSPSAEELKLCLHIFYLPLCFASLQFRWRHLGSLNPFPHSPPV